MAQFLYNVILFPLVQIIEFVYLLVHGIFLGKPCPAGYAIIGVSVAITLLCLPLYIVAEKWQQVERDTQKKLEPGISRIKAVFKGDEQYMILRTFYRQNGYHPMMALRSSFGLLIQIPFFMAAYTYLSHLEELKGLSFLFINDLGAPDATFHIGAFPVNVLPIAMTLINCISGAIYTKGFKVKDKIQVYGMAALFLVILYQSPAGLVLYWTMNNIFSMVKNIFYKMKKPLLVFYCCACAAVAFIDWFLLFRHGGYLYKRLSLVFIFSLVFFIPLFLKLVKILLDKPFAGLVENKKASFGLFASSCAVILFVFGLYIITSVISASPVEFSFIDSVESPFVFIRSNFSRLLGLCVVWPMCIYFLFGKRIKACISLVFAFLAASVLINVFAFPGNYGNLTQILTLESIAKLHPSKVQVLLNLSVLFAAALAVAVIVVLNKSKWVIFAFGFGAAALVLSSSISFGKISREYRNYAELRKSQGEKNSLEPVFHLSRTGQNIFVVDFDRFIGALVPEIFNEHPELYDVFSGFTFYPNTASYCMGTIAGSPPMFGGYEYTPQKMNQRNTESLVSKHNEATFVMPVLFMNNGFNVTVSDISFANYSWIPDMSSFDRYPDISAFNTARTYKALWASQHPEVVGKDSVSSMLITNSFWYSLLRISPCALRELIYNSGRYWNSRTTDNKLNNFIEPYSALDYLPELTDFTSEKPTYTFFVNDSTHEPLFLQAPDYVPVKQVTDFGPGKYSREEHYHVDSAALLRFAEWINLLKENGVYDNTRIIIVSDHGAAIPTDVFPELNDTKVIPRIEGVNPVLMVKDFNAVGKLKTDMDFMTNADVAAISCDGVIPDPVNPFTGNRINMDGKSGDVIYGGQPYHFSPDNQNKNTFKIGGWFTVGKDMFSPDAVRSVSEKEAMEAAE